MSVAPKPIIAKISLPSRWFDSSANRARFMAGLICLLVAVVWAFRLPPFAWLWGAAETAVQDALLRARTAARTVSGVAEAPRNVVLLTIDDESVRALGAYPPLPRQVYAHLCRSLEEAGASVIAFQIIFDGPSPAFRNGRNVPPQLNSYIKNTFGDQMKADATADDAALEEAFNSRQNIVLGSQVDTGLLQRRLARAALLTPNERFVAALRGGSCLGNLLVDPDPDGIVRRATVYGDRFPGHWSFNTSFAVRVLEKKYGAAAIETADGVFLNGKFIPRTFRIDFAGPAGTFETIPLWKALEWRKYYNQLGANSQVKSLMQNPFAGKVVLIGYQDLSPSDAGAVSSGSPGMLFNSLITPVGGIMRPMSTAELQANIIENIMESRFLCELPRWQEFILLLGLGGLYAFFAGLSRGRTVALMLMTVLMSLCWFAICVVAFTHFSLLIPCMVPILGIFATSFLFIWIDENVVRAEQRRRKTRLFRRLASRQVADEIDREHLDELGLAGKEAEITVLVCEIDNLADLLEGKGAEEAIREANKYIQCISDAVTRNGGVIERYLNHGLVAIWGAPLAQPSAAQVTGAVSAAVDILESLPSADPPVVLTRETPKLAYSGAIADIVDENDLPPGGNSDEPDEQVSETAPRTVCLISVSNGTAVCGMVGSEDNALYTAMGRPVDTAFQLIAENRKFGTRCIVSDSVARLLGVTTFETRVLSTDDGNERKHELLGHKGQLSGALEEATTLYRQAMEALGRHDRREAEHLLESALRLLPDDGPSRTALASCRKKAKAE